MSDPIPTISATSPQSTVSSPSSRPTSPTRGLRRPASHGRLAKLMLPGRARASSSASATNETAYADEPVSSSSGRTTPEQRRRTGKAAATSLLASDAKYKKLAAAVDKSLASFESVNEWADFISFLSRLLKTLQSASPPYGEIPRKLIVSKRLAQCLNPALPSGVHQRALDVYAYIFSTIGVEGLRRDLLVWSSGLFPFFQAAATSVRPILISLYETYYLPLGEDLRPATKALVLALLPGMEEETGDFFDRIYSFFSKLSEAVSPSFFLQNMFLTLISNPSSRLASLNYLSKSLVKAPETVANSSDVGLMLRGVAAALEDENMLVRRNGLDLLLRITPLDGVVFKEGEIADRQLLMRAACSVVLQREVSLSRRVYTWLLGKEESPEKQISYFRTYGLDLLVTVLQNDMETLGVESQSYDAQKPFKVFLSLLDRWEVGASLSNKLAVPALEAIRAGLPRVSPDMRGEMLDTATAVYEAVEPIIIWKTLFESLKGGLNDPRVESTEMLAWLLSSIRQHDEEIIFLHIPVVLDFLLDQSITSTNARKPDAIRLALQLLKLIPESLWSRWIDGQDVLVKEEATSTAQVYESPNPDLSALMDKAKTTLPSKLVSSVFQLSSSAISESLQDTDNLLTIFEMIGYLLDQEPPALKNVQGRAWIGTIVKSLANTHSFPVVDAMIFSILKATRSTTFKIHLDGSHSTITSVMLDTLFRYLHSDFGFYHSRAVELLWECNQLADMHTLETVTARRMSDKRDRQGSYEAFGVLWRLTDDSMLPGELFRIPILMIVDDLENPDHLVRQEAESWIKANLRSYFRVLDPVLSRLLATSREYDTIRYLLDSLCTIIRKSGSEGLRRACQTTSLASSVHPSILQVAADNGSKTYLEFLAERAIAFLELDLSPVAVPRRSGTNDHKAILRVHSASIELMRLLISDGQTPDNIINSIKDCLVRKLRQSTRQPHMSLQPQILSILEIAMAQSSSHRLKHQRKRSVLEKAEVVPESEFDMALVQVILEAVSSPQNRSSLRHWVDFILNITPLIETRPSLVLMLCECFSDQLRRDMLQLKAIRLDSSSSDIRSRLTEAEPLLILAGLERLVLLVLSSGRDRPHSEDGQKAQGEGGLMGLVSGVFTVEAPINDKNLDTVQYLDDAINALLLTWSVTGGTHETVGPSNQTARPDSQIRIRTKSVLDKMFAANPAAVVGCAVQVWAAHSPDITDEAIFDCVDSLAPSAQKAVEIISESVTGRQGSRTETSSDPALMGFLEVYISRLEAPIALQIWNTLFAFARSIISTSNPSTKAQLYPVLRCVTTLSKTVSSTSALEDRRLRRDLQDVYFKLLDGVVSSAGKTETVIWKRDSPKLEKDKLEEGQQDEGLRDIQAFVSERVVPNLRAFLADNDKIANAANSISAGLIVPAFRRQSVDVTVLRVLLELTKLPSATKAWRLQVGEAFNDQRFFKVKLTLATLWKPLICGLMDSDKERFGELLARITAGPSSNIFTNREQEMISRSLNLRRLTFVLLAAERNHYLAQLPSIQEKLVDILRTDVVSPRVHSEVYLCLRVLMCRISPQHLTNFWPVILTELLKVFEGTMDDPPADGSEDLALVLAACKFLDLLLIIQSEDFQIHQWMFVTDTTDAAYPPEDFLPESIMDRLSEILSEHKHTRANHEDIPLDVYDNDTRALRRPRLTNVRHLTSLYQLQPFCARASIDTFEGVYGNQGVDWDTVETGLDREVFEARD